MALAANDENFNRDIIIAPIDGSREPYNLSLHPFNDGEPVWSPDGKMLAFVGARDDKDSTDIHFVYLRREDDEKGSRERKLEKAMEKFAPKKNPFGKGGASAEGEQQPPEPGPQPKSQPAPPTPPSKAGDPGTTPNTGEPRPADKKTKPVEVVIDFDELHDRVRRIKIPNSNERNLFFSPDGKKLAFSATVDGKSGLFSIDVSGNAPPKPTALGNSAALTRTTWLKSTGNIVGLANGVPTESSTRSSAASTRGRRRARIRPRRRCPSRRTPTSTCRRSIEPRSRWPGGRCATTITTPP